MKNESKEKNIKMGIKTSDILIILIGVLLILTSINLYLTASLANRLSPTAGEANNELRGAQPQGAPEQAPRREISISDNDPSIGPENAPITMVEFSDFSCPFCAKAKPTIAQILETYDGRIRFVFRNFPLPIFGVQSQKAAEAAECANEQGRFWDYHDALFANQQDLGDISNLKRFASDVGLNTARFNECLDSGRMAEEVARDVSDGQSYGASGTPAFFINGVFVSGAQSFSVFERVIEQELAR